MMKDKMDGMVPGFYATHRAWYGDHIQDREYAAEVMIGLYDPDDGGGTAGEFAFRWIRLQNGNHCRLEVFDDGWEVFLQMPEVTSFLRNYAIECTEASPSPEDLISWLKLNGFRDLTPYEQPGV